MPALKMDNTLRCSANFSPDGSRIVTAMPHESLVYSANYSPDGTRIVTTSREGTARIWDAVTGHAIGEPMRHEGKLTNANFSPEGSRIVTASNDNTARVRWIPTKDEAIRSITAEILAWARCNAGLRFSEMVSFV